MNILTVDDDHVSRKLLGAILLSEGFSVVEANDGVEAMAVLEGGRIDAVISDILMPNMDGYRLCHEIRRSQQFYLLPFIAYTATSVSEDDARIALELGADAFVRKPATAQAIVAALRDAMRAPVTKSAARSPIASDILQAHIERLRSRLDEEHTVLASKAKIKHLNGQLRESNKKFREFDRSKSEFLATASHEMRTPLAIVREFASLLADGAVGDLSPDQSECIESILRNCVRLSSLLDDLLDLATIEAGKIRLRREELNIARSLKECVADFGPQTRSKEQSLELIMWEGQMPTVLGDRSKIQQILLNLIGNAHKFTQVGGKIVVEAIPEQSNVRVIVSDNGPGIETTQLDAVFDAFKQIERNDPAGLRGTGLGLTITRKLVQYHDGVITVSSGLDKGTTITFTLPTYTVASEHRAFLIDEARCATKGKVGTVIAIAPRSVDGSPVSSDLLAIKSRCDSALYRAKSCRAISEDGTFLYLLEDDAPVSRHSILRLLESVSTPDERLYCERDTINRSNPARSLLRVRDRIQQELGGTIHGH